MNICAKNRQNPLILFKVTIDNVGVPFLRHSVIYRQADNAFSESEAEGEEHASHSALQCTIIADVSSASCEAEARRDSGISVQSVASSLITTTCASELPVISHQTAIVEEPSYDVSSALDEANQPVTGTDDTVPAVLPWISLPTDQGYSNC